MSKAWMPLYIGDYLGDTNHLTQGQHGAYFLLMMHYWQRGPIPCDPMQCYCIARAMDEQERCNVDAVLRTFFQVADAHHHQARLDLELEKAEISYKRRSGAADKRWGRAKQVQSNSNVDALQVQSYSNPCDCDSSSDSSSGSREEIEGQVHEIASLYPKVLDAFHLTREVSEVIAEAIIRDGRDVVWTGTKSAGEAMKSWPPQEKQFIPSAPRFFRESQYRKSPEEWIRNGKAPRRTDGWTPPQNVPADYVPESVKRRQELAERKAQGL